MGAWGVGIFDNDTACDWAFDLENADDLTIVSETLGRVLAEGNEYLDSDNACMGLAACEVVARLRGNWGVRNSYTEPMDNWVEAHPQQLPADLVRQASAVIRRVITPPSELLELWEEGDATEWKNAIEDLRRRIEE
jgi:hypothetical protein